MDVSNVRSRHSAVGHQLAIEGWRRETRAGRGKSARVSRFSSGRGPPDESDRQFKPSHRSTCAAREATSRLAIVTQEGEAEHDILPNGDDAVEDIGSAAVQLI